MNWYAVIIFLFGLSVGLLIGVLVERQPTDEERQSVPWEES